MKAYQYDNDETGYCQIVYAESASKAKMLLETDIAFINIRVHRVKWADKYKMMEDIPVEEFLKQGYWWSCKKCESQLTEDDDYVIEDNNLYCRKCWGEMQEGNK